MSQKVWSPLSTHMPLALPIAGSMMLVLHSVVIYLASYAIYYATPDRKGAQEHDCLKKDTNNKARKKETKILQLIFKLLILTFSTRILMQTGLAVIRSLQIVVIYHNLCICEDLKILSLYVSFIPLRQSVLYQLSLCQSTKF